MGTTDETQTLGTRGNSLQELFNKASAVITDARTYIGQTANYATVLTSFMLGRYIVEEEQRGKDRAAYGAHVLDALSAYLTEEFGRGFSRVNVANMRKFYLADRDRAIQIVQSSITQFEEADSKIVQSPIGQFEGVKADAQIWQSPIAKSANDPDSRPFKLSRTHYQTPMRIEDRDERDLETAVVDKIQGFLMEMDTGFLFEKRQKRFSFNDRKKLDEWLEESE